MRPKNPKKKTVVLVTGASGCVGALLVRELLDRGYGVVATDRPSTQAPAPEPGLTWREADLTDSHQAPMLMRGVDAVIHCAAIVDISLDHARLAPINTDAVRWLYAAAAAVGVTSFVYLSSGSVYAPCDRPFVETDVVAPTSAYELTKLLAEDHLRGQVGRGPRVAVLRPSLVYGPRGKVLVAALATLPRLLDAFDGWIPSLRGGPCTNLVHGLDVARAALHLLEHPQPDGAVFNIASPDVLTIGQIFGTAMAVGGRRLAGLTVPYPESMVKGALPLLRYPAPFRLLNAGAAALWRRVVRAESIAPELAPRADMEAVVYLAGDTVFDCTRLAETGFEFRYPTFHRGWSDTVRWYRDHGWLPARAGNTYNATMAA